VFAFYAVSIAVLVIAIAGLALALNIHKATLGLEKQMATQGQGLTDLQNQQAAILSVVTGISTSIGTVITDLQAVLAQLANPPAGDSDAAVEAVAQQLQANVATLTTLKANLDAAAAAVPPPPATT
jgi:hypothetical protein